MNRNTFKAVRLRKKMSQARFAVFLGVSESTIAAIETGRRGISDTVRARLAEKIEIDHDLISFLESYEKMNRINHNNISII